ncbi:MAG: NAD(P)/FAD-dependent oxidoreductase [Oligoflexales bacterium]
MSEKIAIIGAGVSSCFLSHLLSKSNYDIKIFEKSRGIGGRCAVRRDTVHGEFSLGAQFFTNKNPQLSKYFLGLLESRLIKKLTGPLGYLHENGRSQQATPQIRYIGTPSMNSFLKHWVHGVDINFQSRIESISRLGEKWQLVTAEGHTFDDFDTCILTLPYPQGLQLWQQNSQLSIPETHMYPCFALVLATDTCPLKWHHSFVKDPMIAWFATEHSQNQRIKWVVHADAKWSLKHLEADPNWVQEQMIQRLYSLLEIRPKVHFTDIHRWKYASSESSAEFEFLWDSHYRLGYISDWLVGGRVEGAMESAAALASHVYQVPK